MTTTKRISKPRLTNLEVLQQNSQLIELMSQRLQQLEQNQLATIQMLDLLLEQFDDADNDSKVAKTFD